MKDFELIKRLQLKDAIFDEELLLEPIYEQR